MQKFVADFIIYSRKCGSNFKEWFRTWYLQMLILNYENTLMNTFHTRFQFFFSNKNKLLRLSGSTLVTEFKSEFHLSSPKCINMIFFYL